MVQKGTVNQGDIENKHMLTDVVVIKQAAVNLAKGVFVYQDAALGAKIVPIDSSVLGRRVRFLENASDNTGGAVGDKNVETYKKGAIVIAKCDGAIVVNQRVKASTTTAGRVIALVDPTNPGAAYAEAEADSLYNYIIHGIGTYLGHKGEAEGSGNDPTDAADGDLVRLQLD